MTLTVARVNELLHALDEAFTLGGKLVEMARQREPDLRVDPLPADFAAVDTARAEAIARTKGGGGT